MEGALTQALLSVLSVSHCLAAAATGDGMRRIEHCTWATKMRAICNVQPRLVALAMPDARNL